MIIYYLSWIPVLPVAIVYADGRPRSMAHHPAIPVQVKHPTGSPPRLIILYFLIAVNKKLKIHFSEPTIVISISSNVLPFVSGIQRQTNISCSTIMKQKKEKDMSSADTAGQVWECKGDQGSHDPMGETA